MLENEQSIFFKQYCMKFIDLTNNSDLQSRMHDIEDLIRKGENTVGYGIYDKGCEIPIYFVDIPTMDRQRPIIEQQRKENLESSLEKVRKLIEETENPELKGLLRWYEGLLLSYKKYIPDEGLGIDVLGIDALGIYFPLGNIQKDTPEIWICYDKIAEQFKDIATEMTAMVLVHELAHAIMDITQYTGDEVFYEWMEEPMANKIALKYIDVAI